MKKIILFLSMIFGLASCTHTVDNEVRGVWVPAPRFTSVLHTYPNICRFIDNLKEVGLNTVFLVSYADNKTIYKSNVLLNNSSYSHLDETYMLSDWNHLYNGPSGDPVRDLIDLAHSNDIKIYFWYEYGFMGKGRPISEHDPIRYKHPDWIGVSNDGSDANYNGSDYYYNSYSPQVQNFLIELIKEGIKLYPDIDGIQGDDRMPASPKNSGYDVYTVEKYKDEHDGEEPPLDYEDSAWVQWRLNLLNDFASRLYKEVKELSSKVSVSFAPNPYPWCKEKLMQDWPEWCRRGVCDLLVVQCYRYSIEAYSKTVSEVLKYVQEANLSQKFVLGIILMEGKNLKMSPDLLEKQISLNRSLGIAGEVFFYNEALENEEIKAVLKKCYSR